MAKRLAANQLTQETCEEEDEIVDPGVFQKASASQLKERVMKKAKRQLNSQEKSEGPFASFAGLTSKKSPFLFVSNGKDKNDAATRLVTSIFSSSKSVDTKPISSKPEIPSEPKTILTINNTSNTSSVQHSPQYFRQVKALNESFLKWVKEHLEKNSYADFTPVCIDYQKHAKTLDEKFQMVSKETKTDLFSFGAKNNNPTFSMGASNANCFSFGTKTNSPPTFSFATKVAEAATTAVPLNNTEKPEENEDDNYVPPKSEFTPIEEADSIFSQKCKLFYKKDGTYIEKGRGTLYIKLLGEKTQLLIRDNSSIGIIFLNIMLTSSIPTQKMGKNNVLIVCVPDASMTSSSVPISFLIRVKNSDDADLLLKKIEEYKR